MKTIVTLLLAITITGCGTLSITSSFTRNPIQRTEVAPLIEKQVAQFKDSSRIISITGGKQGEEDLYLIAVKDGASDAKKLITERRYNKIKKAHNDEWLNLPIPDEHRQPK